MVMRIAIAVLTAIVSSGCWDWSRFEAETDSGAFDGRGCAGCWMGGDCVDGNATDACGRGGVQCAACGCSDDACTDGACIPAEPVVSIGTGHQFVCVATEGATVYCMGNNSDGQLGIGAESAGSATFVATVESGFTALSSGGDRHVVALTAGGMASYWGWRPGTATVAARAASLSRSFDRVASGGEFVCGIEGTALSCSGGNDHGQLGVGDTTTTTNFLSVAGSWTTVSAGLGHTCAIQGDGQLYCWGDNAVGQLGIGSIDAQQSPMRVGAESDWDEVASGKDFTCGRRGGRVYCWGANHEGQLGGGTVSDDPPVTLPGAALRDGSEEIDDAMQISAGRFHACALRSDRSIWCWGSNDCGAVGDGSYTRRPSPTRVSGDRRFDSVAVGHHVTCALEHGALFCWGRRGDRLVHEYTLDCPNDDPSMGVLAGLALPERICL